MQVDLGGGRSVRLGGIAKGSGMIHPNMATMLAVVTCDAPVDAGVWSAMFKRGSAASFNQITVDGDTSTNDCGGCPGALGREGGRGCGGGGDGAGGGWWCVGWRWPAFGCNLSWKAESWWPFWTGICGRDTSGRDFWVLEPRLRWAEIFVITRVTA